MAVARLAGLELLAAGSLVLVCGDLVAVPRTGFSTGILLNLLGLRILAPEAPSRRDICWALRDGSDCWQSPVPPGRQY